MFGDSFTVTHFLLVIVIYLAVIAIIVLVIARILYSVVWRAVRRGLREYHAVPAPTPGPGLRPGPDAPPAP